jgi:hypothetical protein
MISAWVDANFRRKLPALDKNLKTRLAKPWLES